MKPLEEMGKFATVVVDPPWPLRLAPTLTKTGNHQKGSFAPNLPYSTRTIDDISSLPIESLLDTDALVFCWTINQYLPQTFNIVEGWGCKYWFTMTWHKADGPQVPNAPKFNSEWIVVGKHGNPRFDDIKMFFATNAWKRDNQMWKGDPHFVSTHSEKPEGFYDLLRRCDAWASPGRVWAQTHRWVRVLGQRSPRRSSTALTITKE